MKWRVGVTRHGRSRGAAALSRVAKLGAVLVIGLYAVACGDPAIISPAVLTAWIYPPHGAVDISPRVEGLVYFSSAVSDPAAVEQGITLACLGAPPCDQPVASGCPTDAWTYAVSYDAAGQLARVKPEADLEPSTCYVFIVPAGIEAEDPDVAPIPVELRSAFQTR